MGPMGKKPAVIGAGDGYGVSPYMPSVPQGAPLNGERPMEEAARQQFVNDVAQYAKKIGIDVDYDLFHRALYRNNGSQKAMTVPEYSGHLITNVGSGADSIKVSRDDPNFKRDSDEMKAIRATPGFVIR